MRKRVKIFQKKEEQSKSFNMKNGRLLGGSGEGHCGPRRNFHGNESSN